jgi:predicted nucleotidyltransferase
MITLNSDLIDSVKKYLGKTEACKAYIFGSYAKGKQDLASDLDILVDFEPTITLLKFVRYKRELENILQIKIDLQTTSSLSPYVLPLIQKDLKIIYERK